jgi:catechol 2,3-dioxygenase-like lactoylglutathione lyase family enzyme
MLADGRCYATLPVSDLDATRKFYEGVLGFKTSEENPGGVVYQAGEGTTFAITLSSGKPAGNHTQLGFAVSSIEAEVADLKRRGIVFQEYDYPTLKTVGSIARVGPGRGAWFLDPAGNMIGLIQLD